MLAAAPQVDDFARRDTMDPWQSGRSKPVRPELEKVAEARVEPNLMKCDTKRVDHGPSPSIEVLSAQLQSLMAAYSKLMNRDVDLSDHTQLGARRFAAQTGRRRVPDARTEPRKQKIAATSSRLLATTASRAAAIRQRSKRLATPRMAPEQSRMALKKNGQTFGGHTHDMRQPTHISCDQPQTAHQSDHALPSPESHHPQADDINIARPSRRALNPFPQLSPFLPQHRPLAKTPFPQPSSGRGPTPIDCHSRTLKKVERPLHNATIPGALKSACRIQIPSSKKTPPQTAPLRPPTPPTKATFSASQPGNPFKDILAKGISPTLDVSPLPVPRRRAAA